MNKRQVRQILKDTDFVHTGGSAEELRVAEYLAEQSRAIGAEAHLEPFPVEMADMHAARLTVTYANGTTAEVPCEGFRLCGSGEVDAPFVYLPNTDPASLTKVKGSIVMLDTGIPFFTYQDLIDHGAVGIITYDGNLRYRDNDIDARELRPYVRGDKEKILGVNINAKEAFKLIKAGVQQARIFVDETEYAGESRNVVAEIPGTSDEWIVLTAHYDTTPLSHGSYDNMSGCIGLLCIMDNMIKNAPHRYGLRFVFCGSEERGLLGSKAYVKDHAEELEKICLNINLDMIGTFMGRFIGCVSAEDALVSYISYMASEIGFGINVRSGVYSSDSTPFADQGVPAVSFARIAGPSQATIHNRYDSLELLSDEQLLADGAFLTTFTAHMADAVKCPVKREIPENIKKELDEYLARKRKG
ncbi:MAG: M28 family peptidase [Firmicutes bacterium]|nr:M28 family peptidase [Bacillota bacterium]